MTAAFIDEVMSFEPQNRSFLEFDLLASRSQSLSSQIIWKENLPKKECRPYDCIETMFYCQLVKT
jgi:hypothetical protein